jgi:hypothetical protein
MGRDREPCSIHLSYEDVENEVLKEVRPCFSATVKAKVKDRLPISRDVYPCSNRATSLVFPCLGEHAPEIKKSDPDRPRDGIFSCLAGATPGFSETEFLEISSGSRSPPVTDIGDSPKHR